MNVLIVLATYYPHVGGVSSHISTLSRQLRSRDEKVYIYTLSSFPSPVRIAFTAFSLFFDSVRKGLGLFLIRIIAFKLLTGIIIFSYCLAKDIDIIHAHDCVALNSTWFASRSLKIPTVLTVHGYSTLEPIAHGDLDKKANTLARFLAEEEKNAYENADQIITVDSKLREHVLKFYVSKSKVSKIENVVDPDEFSVDLDKTACREMFNLPYDKAVILLPRRLVGKCGVLLPLYALQYVSEPIKHKLLLVYCGTGPKEKDIRKYVQKNGLTNVILLGAVPHDKMKYMYRASDIVLIPSIPVQGVEEATSISALEAMAVCVPVIASNIGGLKEIVTNGVNGVLVQPEPESVAKAVNDLLTGTRSYDKRQARQFVKESLVRNIEKTRYVYVKASIERL